MDKQKFLTGLLSRKFLFSVVLCALSYVALMLGRLDGSAWVTVTSLILGVYTAGNVVQKSTSKLVEPKPTEPEEGSV